MRVSFRLTFGNVRSLNLPGADSEDVSLHGHEVNLEDIPNSIGGVNGPEQADDDWDFLDPGSPTELPSRRSLSPPSPPKIPHVTPWPTKSSVQKVWSKSKKLFTEKFGRRQSAPKLSDKLVPERDEVRWYEALFSKPPKSVSVRKYSYFTVDT